METDSSVYFTSYEDLEVHQLMLEDSARTLAYKNAILDHSSYFKDKIVMDVGCGTGILSVFCAQAGAKKVYAVEASSLAELAKEVVKENNFDNVIEVIHSKVEDLVLPNVKVDAIVSEWMGFYLLHEGMLDSVLTARDMFLKEDGQIFPESAVVYMAPCSLPSQFKQWEDFHGIKMTSFGKHLRQSKADKPDILCVKPEDLLSPETALCWINLKEDKISDLECYTMEHILGSTKPGSYQGVCVWFTCLFPHLCLDKPQLTLDTSPFAKQTHWKQTVIVLPEEREVDEGEPIAFQLDMKRDVNNNRRYTLQMTMLDPEVVEHPIPCTCHMTKCIVIKTFMTQHPGQQPRQDKILEMCEIDDDE